MKNNLLNKVIVACVATIGLFGYQNLTVKANDQIHDYDKNRLLIIGEQKTVPENIVAQSEPALPITDEEKDLFARLVEAEAKGEPYEGKVAVAEVVLNRVQSPEFPDTVTGVVTEVVGKSYAFSPVQNGEINKPASDEAKQAVCEALTSDDHLNEAVYFYNPEIATDDWIRSREVVTTIGDHTFAK
ncbi:spore cortex-lytic protein [Bacillus sp. DNRA2]|uniref:cell wall hydrolase n=1 Tax=Bacillus sp. DNRA2 TaxID=2723053 RepID=UPI00145DA0F9|nr:cell wall hydrolase [Bacillus sp. DNRA2]NMD71714.1 spore cortex-lytic protein [Bacillus sp. DNRA2]